MVETSSRVASEADLAALLQSIEDYAIYLLDPAGRVVSWNAGAQALKGYVTEEILGRDFAAFYTEEDRQRGAPRAALEAAATSGRFEGEGWRVRKDGSRFWANVIIRPVHDGSGAQVGFSKVTRNLTARREAEEAVRRVNQQLEAQVAARTSALEAEMASARMLAERLRVLSMLAQEFASVGNDYERLIQVVCERVVETLGDGCEVLLVQGDSLALSASYHPDPSVRADLMRLRSVAPVRVGEGLLGRVVATRRPVFMPVTNPAEIRARSLPQYKDLVERLAVHSLIVVPLQAGGAAIGAIAAFRSSLSRPYTESDLQLLLDLATPTALAINNARAHEALRKSEERYRTLIEETTSQGVWAVDALGITTFANRRMANMLGTTPEAMLGANGLVHVLEPSAEVIAARRAQRRPGVPEIVQLRLRRADGSDLWVTGTVSPIFSADGVYRGAVTMLSDVTASKATEEALRRTEEQLRHSQKMEALGRLAGGIAHDFNNLLSVVLSYGHLFAEELPPDSAMHSHVVEMIQASERAAELTRQLLLFSRQQVIQPSVIQLDALISSLDRMLRRLLGEDVELVCRSSPHLAPLIADRGSLEQVVMNLAVNARDAMPTGGRLTIETANVVLDEAYVSAHPGTRSGPAVMLAVTDTGIGMDAQTQARAFEPFFTTKPVGKGTGLGLSTVSAIAEQWGGTVSVDSAPGRGATFRVHLPAAVGLEAEASRAAKPPVLGGRETLLLVEDHPQVRGVARAILSAQGYKVLVARGGDEALRLCRLQDGPIDLLLTDVVLPDVDGVELESRIKAVRPQIRTLFMSGYTEDRAVRGLFRQNDVAFLQKPFTPTSLGAKVRAVLDDNVEG